MWVYVGTLNQTYSGSLGNNPGSVTFGSNPPIKGVWPLAPGSYKVHVLRSGYIYNIFASSKTFTVQHRYIKTSKLVYDFNESIAINWDYPDTKDGDWIGLYPNNSPPSSNYIMWIDVGTLNQTYTGLLGNSPGSVTFGINPPVKG
jgi:hypothetical protein